MRVLKAPDRAHQRQLNVERQAGGNPVRIDLARGQSFGLEEDLMPGLARESMHLVLDRRAIAWADPLDDPREHGRAIQSATDDLVRTLVGMRHPARHLPGVHVAPTEEREHGFWNIAGLRLQHGEIDRISVEPRRCAGFQAPDRQLHFPQARCEGDRGRIPCTPGLITLQADVDQPGQECSRSKHDRASP